jgi:Gas vesicle synthesis protein GvpL/GvpF
LVSDLDAAQLAAANEIRAHWGVLEAVGEWATVLPVRFGTVMEDDEAVRERLLRPHEDRLANLLDELAGRVQLSVKGTYVEKRVLGDIVRETPAIASLNERVRSIPDEAGYYQRINLGEMVFRELDRRRDADARLALDRLEPLAVAAQAEPAGGANGAFDLAFLVDREKVPEFSAAVAGLGDEVADRIDLRYVGPLPPYSFADAELTAGSA